MKSVKFGLRLTLMALFLLEVSCLTGSAAEPDQNEGQEDKVKLDTMVVSATKTEISIDQATKSISVVDGAELLEKQQFFLPELIDNQPGVYLKRSGGIGQFSTISIRGAGTQHTLFQYNGMPLRDVADTQSTLQYFIEDLFSAGSIDRVEILKGTNSVLHGSSAMGGVINIIPKTDFSGWNGQWRNEFGPNSTYSTQAGVAYGHDKGYVNLNTGYITTDGETNGGPYGYEYDQRGIVLGGGYNFTDDILLQFTALYSDSDLALGTSPSLDANHELITTLADKDRKRESLLSQYGLAWNHTVTDIWDYTIKGTYGETERHYFWSDIQGDQSNYDGEIAFVEMQHNVGLGEFFDISVGLDYENQVYDGREPRNPSASDYSSVYYDESWYSQNAFGLLQGHFMDESLLVNVGARYNDHEEFGGKTIWEASTAYIFQASDTKLHAHVGTGYRTPSLYEIYGGYLSGGTLITIGNENLIPEESLGWEVGIEQRFLDRKYILGVTYFETEFDDLIIYDGFANQYDNASKARNRGVEVYLETQPFESLAVDFSYTYMDSQYKESSTATDYTRKEYLPRNIFDLIVTWYATNNLTLTLDVSYQDEKILPLYDPSYNRIRYEEGSSITADIAGTYKVLDFLDLFVRVENLTDEDYTESGYQMPGRSIYGGLRMYF